MKPSGYLDHTALVPGTGNLAWAPQTQVDRIDILDRHNGVPTFGVVWIDGRGHLFWRVLGYVGDLSVWLYVPLTDEDHRHLEEADAEDVLSGIVFDSSGWRYVAVGISEDNRLIFEREWQLPADLAHGSLIPLLLDFMSDALDVALTQEPLPASRRDIVQRASKAVRELVSR
jgi:hypothetical protein